FLQVSSSKSALYRSMARLSSSKPISSNRLLLASDTCPLPRFCGYNFQTFSNSALASALHIVLLLISLSSSLSLFFIGFFGFSFKPFGFSETVRFFGFLSKPFGFSSFLGLPPFFPFSLLELHLLLYFSESLSICF